MFTRAASFARTMSETMDVAHAVDEEEDGDVVAIVTLTLLALGFGLGAAFVVGINRARGSVAPLQ